MSSLRGGPRHSATAPEDPGGSSPVSLGLELAFTALVVVVVSFVLKTFVIQSFFIPSESMEDTLLVKDRIMVSKLAPGPFDIHRGDIVVFHDPSGWSNDRLDLPEDSGLSAWLHGAAQSLGFAPESADDFIVKRVIGLPGDVVACDGPGFPVTINGQAIYEEEYLKPGSEPSAMAFEVEVPPDAYWVMGDNRSNSADSRFHQDQDLDGAIPEDGVVGVAKLRLWPLNRFSVLRNPSAVFQNVPEAGAASGG